MTTPQETPEYRADALIRRMWARLKELKPVLDMVEDSQTIAEHLSRNQEFVDIFARDYLLLTVRDIGEHLSRRIPDTAHVGSLVGSREDIIQMVKGEIEDGFAIWMEYDPKVRVRRNIVDMTKVQLIEAADRRQERAQSEAGRSGWLRSIAARMEEGQTVKDVWSMEALRELRASVVPNVTTTTISHLRQAAD